MSPALGEEALRPNPGQQKPPTLAGVPRPSLEMRCGPSQHINYRRGTPPARGLS